MKAETDPITDEEWLLRLVWEDRFTNPISPNAFEPRDGRHPDTDGLSLFRESCLHNPEQALAVIPEDKRPRYGIVRVSVRFIRSLGLNVKHSPIETVPGHVVVPELNIGDYKADKVKFMPIKIHLAAEADNNIVRKPEGSVAN